ncbi:MAG: glycosyltransferase family 2 protein [Firmicutes bacterium]|nr:glycosyltransferase family 2 protein [Bacillota bacterium]
MSVVAIIPAYNEEKTIGGVLETLKKVDLINNIIVVSDGSTDKTVEVAKKFEVDVLELKENLGKGGALKAGIEKAKGKVVLFLDADLIGLKENHVRNLILPVLDDEADMTVGIFDRGRVATDLAQKIAPFLSGQRAVNRKVLNDISNLEITRYGVEIALTKYVESSNLRVKKVVLKDLTHIMKEEKMGLLKGFTERMRMYMDIIKCLIKSSP